MVSAKLAPQFYGAGGAGEKRKTGFHHPLPLRVARGTEYTEKKRPLKIAVGSEVKKTSSLVFSLFPSHMLPMPRHWDPPHQGCGF